MKILHVTFHIGTCNALKSVLDLPDVSLETRIVTSGIDGYFYNMTSQRALNAWNLHKDYYNQFDVIVTSDTAPLSRILIEGSFKGKILIWISNRFDYGDSRDPEEFPDEDYYDLLRNREINTYLIANCQFESIYASKKWIAVDDVINPASKPYYVDEKEGYYVPMYSNDTLFYLCEKCFANEIQVTTGRYKDQDALAHFKAVVHLPYTWNSIALWDALACGVAYYVPTKEFLLQLAEKKGYWFQNANYLKNYIDYCEFYRNDKFVKYFNSFEELNEIEVNSKEIYTEAERLFKLNQEKWINILNS
jgi:hypothetical protein